MSQIRTPLPEASPGEELEPAPSTQRARAEQRDTNVESHAHTPRFARNVPASGQSVRPPSSADTAPEHVDPNPSQDTLLSLPRPAARHEFEISERLSEFERRLDDLVARVKTLEIAPRAPTPEAPNRQWLVWIGFLVALGIAWQIAKRLH
jgi:hypothetical protein